MNAGAESILRYNSLRIFIIDLRESPARPTPVDLMIRVSKLDYS